MKITVGDTAAQINVTFKDSAGQPMNLPNGVADLAVSSFYIVRDGAIINMDEAVGTSFSQPDVTEVGEYFLQINATGLADSAAAAIELQAEDDLVIKVSGEYATGQFEFQKYHAEVVAPAGVGRPSLN